MSECLVFSKSRERFAAAQVVMTDVFQRGFAVSTAMEERLASAMADVWARPGSLIRATTAYCVSLEVGLTEEEARALGCGIEYLHTASLIFDDLPAMDDARIRRGAPCLHVAYGEGIAMLVALALINKGYGLLWSTMARRAERFDRAGKLLEECLGTSGLVGGQAMDLKGWREQQNPDEVTEVAIRKTAALVRLPVVLPALLGNASEREILLLDRLSLLRGLAYQAADDLKDVVYHQEEAGKTSGRDDAMGRPNLALAQGVKGALRRFQKLQSIGDRIQDRLTSQERWWMLRFLRIDAPLLVGHGQSEKVAG